VASGSFSGLLFYQCLLFSALVLLPSVITGMSLPLTGKLYPKRLQSIGRSFGRIGLIGFLSALAGLILTKFILIPLAGLYYGYFILALFIILSGVYLILRDSRLVRGFRFGYAILSVVLYFVIIGALKNSHFGLSLSGKSAIKQPIRKIEGNTTTLSTLENADGGITVLLDNQFFFSSDQKGMTVQQMPAFLPLLFNSNIQSAVVVGFGMGTTASALEASGVKSIHITEIFPEIIRFSSDVFAEINDDIMTSSHVNITIEDARSYLNRIGEETDLITTGCAQLDQMPNNYTPEFYRLCSGKLTDTGVICQVLPVCGISAPEFRALIKACSDVFSHISLWYLSPDRLLMLGSKSSEKTGLCQLSSEFSALNEHKGLTNIGIPDIESLIAHLLVDDRQLRKYVETAKTSNDDKPYVQYSHMINKKTDGEIIKFLVNTKVDYRDFTQVKDACTMDTIETIRKVKKINEALKHQMVLSSGLQQQDGAGAYKQIWQPVRQYP
jgi:spermidine synthase